MEIDTHQSLFDASLHLEKPLHVIRSQATGTVDRLRHNTEHGVIIRDIWASDVIGTEEPEVTLEMAQEHYTVLRKLGLCIVSHTQEVLPQEAKGKITWHEDEVFDYVVAHAASRYVPDSQPLYNEETKMYMPVDLERIKILAIEPLRRYLGWCTLTRQPYILSDVYTPNNYSTQHTSGVLFLHDIEPLILMAYTEDFTTRYEDLKYFEAGRMPDQDSM